MPRKIALKTFKTHRQKYRTYEIYEKNTHPSTKSNKRSAQVYKSHIDLFIYRANPARTLFVPRMTFSVQPVIPTQQI